MKIKVGNTHYKNFPERFKDNKNQRPIPMIELWFTDLEIMRIKRDGFIMPQTDEIIELYNQLIVAISNLDDINAIKQRSIK